MSDYHVHITVTVDRSGEEVVLFKKTHDFETVVEALLLADPKGEGE